MKKEKKMQLPVLKVNSFMPLKKSEASQLLGGAGSDDNNTRSKHEGSCRVH